MTKNTHRDTPPKFYGFRRSRKCDVGSFLSLFKGRGTYP